MSIACAYFSDKQLNVICTIYVKGYGILAVAFANISVTNGYGKNAVASYS